MITGVSPHTSAEGVGLLGLAGNQVTRKRAKSVSKQLSIDDEEGLPQEEKDRREIERRKANNARERYPHFYRYNTVW